MPNSEWFYASNGVQSGPVTWDVLESMARSGALSPDDLIWTEGMGEWQPARTRQGLFAAPVAQVAPSQYGGAAGAGVAPGLVQPGYGGYAPPGLNYYGAPQGQFVYAGFWLRFVAYIIDAIIIAIVGAIIGFVIGIVGASAGGDMEGIKLIAQLLEVILGWLYYAILESSASGATLGKLALGLRVVDLNGERIGFGRATGRHFSKYVSAIILCIGFMMAGWTEKKQGLHDIMAGTLVIRK